MLYSNNLPLPHHTSNTPRPCLLPAPVLLADAPEACPMSEWDISEKGSCFLPFWFYDPLPALSGVCLTTKGRSSAASAVEHRNKTVRNSPFFGLFHSDIGHASGASARRTGAGSRQGRGVLLVWWGSHSPQLPPHPLFLPMQPMKFPFKQHPFEIVLPQSLI